MKKILTVFILAIIASGGVFAETSFSVILESAVDGFYMRSLSGGYSAVVQDSIYRFQGDGDIRFFQPSVFGDSLNGRARFQHIGERLGGFLELRANIDQGALGNWQWETWVRPISQVKILAGNREQLGSLERYIQYNDFLTTRIDRFGVFYPTYHWTPHHLQGDNLDTVEDFPWGYDANGIIKGFATFRSTYNNDMFLPAGSNIRPVMNFLVDVNIAPIAFTASLGGLFSSISRPFEQPWEAANRSATRGNFYDDRFSPVLQDSMNFGLRLEAAGLANMVTVAAVYKYAETALQKLQANDDRNIVDEQTGSQTFGIYASTLPNVLPFGLVISGGYSALTRSWSNSLDTDFSMGDIEDLERHFLSGFRSADFPFYHGIDFRVEHNSDRLNVKFHNNVSFASITGTEDTRTWGNYVVNWAYRAQLNTNNGGGSERSESYLGFYNAIGASYVVTDNLTADLQIANQRGLFTLNWEHGDRVSITNRLGLYAGITLSIVESERVNATLLGGVSVTINSFSYDQPVVVDPKTDNAGYVLFGIPLGIRIQF